MSVEPRDRRPAFHVTAERGWLNDPNGPITWDGRHHLFFQHNPAATSWAADLRWGHVVSDDLARWERLPDALAPTPGGADAGGCWSGCVVDDAGTPSALYSGLTPGGAIGAEAVCLARGDAGLVRWRADPASPVIAGPPPGMDVLAFRDPFAWRDGDGWRLVMGAGLPGRGGAVLTYTSRDLLAWDYAGVLLCADAVADPLATGAVWECPQLFGLGGRHVLLVSVLSETPQASHALAFVGDLRDGRLAVEHVERVDHGPDCFAPATSLDDRGRRLAWGWAWEARAGARTAAGQAWAGVLTLPRVLTLGPGDRLRSAPAPELATLRGRREMLGQSVVGPGRPAVVPRTRGDRLELGLTVGAGSAAAVRLAVCASPDGEERTVIEWRPASGEVAIDRDRASRDPEALGGRHAGVLAPAPDELDLRVFVDRSIVEVYAGGRLTLTARIYPTRADATGVAVTAAGGDAALRRLDVWTLAGRGP